jgi:hypothetical protein
LRNSTRSYKSTIFHSFRFENASLSLNFFNDGSDSLTTATAGTKGPKTTGTVDQVLHTEHGDAAARRAIGMNEGNGTCIRIPVIHIDFLTSPPLQLPDNGQVLRGEGIVALNDIKVG